MLLKCDLQQKEPPGFRWLFIWGCNVIRQYAQNNGFACNYVAMINKL